jgi:hypothetical protein
VPSRWTVESAAILNDPWGCRTAVVVGCAQRLRAIVAELDAIGRSRYWGQPGGAIAGLKHDPFAWYDLILPETRHECRTKNQHRPDRRACWGYRRGGRIGRLCDDEREHREAVLADLRAKWAEGIASGGFAPLDPEEVKAAGRRALNA